MEHLHDRRLGLCLALLMALAGRAWAHEGGTDARGVVKSISGEQIVVTTTSGAEVRAAIVGTTQVVRGAADVRALDVRPGERVVLHASERQGRLEAKLIKVAAGKGPQVPQVPPGQ